MQTLPEREGDPSPPPDNGQHIALGCFTEYLAFLDRIGEGALVRAACALSLPVIDEQPHGAQISAGLDRCSRVRHLPLRDRVPLVWQLLAPARGRAGGARRRDVRGLPAPALGRSRTRRDRALLGRLHPACAQPARGPRRAPRRGLFTVQTALLGSPCEPATSMLPGEAARLDARRRGAAARSSAAVRPLRPGCASTTLDDLDADAVVVAMPPAESARLLGEAAPELEHSPIVSVHLLFDRPLLRHAARRAARLGCALGLRSRRARPVTSREQGQYLTVVSSGVPGADGDPRARARRHIAAQLTGTARSRGAVVVARQPRAACDRRPPSRDRRTPARPADFAPACRARGRVDRDRLARDDGERRALRPHGSKSCCPT